MELDLIQKVQIPIVRTDKVNRTKWRFWPSEASCVYPDGTVIGQCIRRTYYQWVGENVTDPADEWVMNLAQIGNFLEEKTRQECIKKGIYPTEANKKSNRKQQVEIYKDVLLSGEVDILIADERQHAGIEVKSYSNSTYKIKARPKDPHLLQAFLYANFYKPRQDYFIIYYRPSMISKYAEEDVYHIITLHEENGEVYPMINGQVDRRITINKILERFKEAKYYIENNKLPVREFTKSSKECSYCPYKTKCWADRTGSKLGEKNGA